LDQVKRSLGQIGERSTQLRRTARFAHRDIVAKDRLTGPTSTIRKFVKLAKQNGIDARKVLKENMPERGTGNPRNKQFPDWKREQRAKRAAQVLETVRGTPSNVGEELRAAKQATQAVTVEQGGTVATQAARTAKTPRPRRNTNERKQQAAMVRAIRNPDAYESQVKESAARLNQIGKRGRELADKAVALRGRRLLNRQGQIYSRKEKTPADLQKQSQRILDRAKSLVYRHNNIQGHQLDARNIQKKLAKGQISETYAAKQTASITERVSKDSRRMRQAIQRVEKLKKDERVLSGLRGEKIGSPQGPTQDEHAEFLKFLLTPHTPTTGIRGPLPKSSKPLATPGRSDTAPKPYVKPKVKEQAKPKMRHTGAITVQPTADSRIPLVATKETRTAKRVNVGAISGSMIKDNSVVHLSGNTYATRDKIKRMGGKWNPDAKEWKLDLPSTMRERSSSANFLRELDRSGVTISQDRTVITRAKKIIGRMNTVRGAKP
jgi:hypothetical protein